MFEGADGAGKTTLSQAFANLLRALGRPCEWMSFPGSDEGTLGGEVYALHHRLLGRTAGNSNPTSIQVLHIAAHIDAIERRILPALHQGRDVVLDRFWWSTWAYGRASGADARSLWAMIRVERAHWRGIAPARVFLLSRPHPDDASIERRHLAEEYERLAIRESRRVNVSVVKNEHSAAETVSKIADIAGVRPHRSARAQVELPLAAPPPSTRPRASTRPGKFGPATPTIVFDTYWAFASERQRVFFNRVEGHPLPWSGDPIVQQFKFTNAYRASDRTSQYLIRNVIYDGDQAPADVFFRVLLFKLFNKIDTWELLERELGTLCWSEYSFARYDRVLSSAAESGRTLYSAAYIMPSGGRGGEPKKHRMHLRLLERMMHDDVADRIADCASMEAAFRVLRGYPTIGDFLAYQYITDLTYSSFLTFSEMEFVCPGPGAKDGIRKCFSDLGGLSESDVIRRVAEEQDREFARRDIAFRDLWGRPLQLIDCQNLFCEVDKYARVRHPEVSGRTGRTRIKQRFTPTQSRLQLWYPPKWGLNERVEQSLKGHVGGETSGPRSPSAAREPASEELRPEQAGRVRRFR
ncbi:nucleotide kinase domain-containing protein [Anaeromyxobacter sp. PSR-1]|uniref:nucleotide kinase domain-containing protein n=1 Tax=Anaeromyxobacter sp. PSR-1 TaxID=1300915 RepID=UPI001ED9BE96|nr:nucleotide kinase domain-containing protein [Anaeromyxobacter sp. PSR-1]